MTITAPIDGDDLDPAWAKDITDAVNALAGTMTTWTPTHTNLTIGSTPVRAKYRQIQDLVFFRWRFVFSAGAAVGTGPTFTLPVAPSSDYVDTAAAFLGAGYLIDASGGARQAAPLYVSGSVITVQFWNATPANTGITATVPWTWTTNDIMAVWGMYHT